MLNREFVPVKLQHLIPLVEKWGIGDDDERDNLVYHSTEDEKLALVASINDELADDLNRWFIDPIAINQNSEEYHKYSAFFMVYEYAKVLLYSVL